MVVWLDTRVVLALHDRQLAEHGGNSGVRDAHLLESALGRPQQLYVYGDPPPNLVDLAASLTFGLARNYSFVDGNKRTAAVACEAFIELNDARLQASDADLYTRYLALAEGKLAEREFAAWLRAHIQTAPRQRVQEPRAPTARRKPVGKRAAPAK